MKSRWNGIRSASVAVAGACLSSSLASASTVTRAADFETEFEPGDVSLAAKPAQLALAAAAAPAGDFWEQTLVGYLDKLVARDCEKCDDVADKAAVVTKDAGKADPDWDLAEPPVVVAGVNTEWDIDEPAPVVTATAKCDTDWDIDEPAPIVAAAIDPDWDLDETAVVVAARTLDADWDLEEPATPGDAQAAAASEPAPAAPTRDPNPDWDLEEPAVASTSPEVTRTDDTETDFDLFP